MIDATFIRSLGILIVAAALFALPVRAMKMPSILAYLAAGLALGPVTGLVHISPSLELISETGIVLLLFLVGLELSFEKIRDLGRAAVLAGLGQVTLTGGIGWLLCRGLGFRPLDAAFVAAAVTFSSTVVVVKLLEEKRQFDQLHGRMAVGILLVQDLVVIVLLTFLSGYEGRAGLEFGAVMMQSARAFGGLAGLLAVVILASRYGLPRPFGWAARRPETIFIWSLCWCFAVVLGAHLLRLSPASGAFLAGLGLAQLPYNQDLRRRVRPLMNFFMAVFFVALGIQMELGPARAHWPAVLALSGFVLAGKFLIVMGLVAGLRFSERTSALTSLTLAQVSEFSFILVAAGVKAGLVGPELLSVVGTVGLITIALSACMILYDEVLWEWMRRSGVLRLFGAARISDEVAPVRTRQGHIIVVGMNTLGRQLIERLQAGGEIVLAIDTDPHKLAGLPCDTLLGNVNYSSVLETAGLARAKLLVSALRIEETNDWLAYQCRRHRVPCAVHVVDLSVVDNLLEMDASYLMIPKVDGVKLQNRELTRLGYLR
jgi:Kef-type K+ transport system membrane component KefB